MPGMKDYLGERNLTFGEVGAFLSHYFIWIEVFMHAEFDFVQLARSSYGSELDCFVLLFVLRKGC